MELIESYCGESACLLELLQSEDGVLSVKSMDDLLEDAKAILIEAFKYIVKQLH